MRVTRTNCLQKYSDLNRHTEFCPDTDTALVLILNRGLMVKMFSSLPPLLVLPVSCLVGQKEKAGGKKSILSYSCSLSHPDILWNQCWDGTHTSDSGHALPAVHTDSTLCTIERITCLSCIKRTVPLFTQLHLCSRWWCWRENAK